MRAMLLAGAMTLAVVGNVKAGWFGLTEDYPFSEPGPERRDFVLRTIKACMNKGKVKNLAASISLSNSQQLYLCNCRAEEMANVTTKKQWDYIVQSKSFPDGYVQKMHAADGECFEQMMLEDRQGN